MKTTNRTVADVPTNKEQNEVSGRILEGHHVLITGQAGSGKTQTLKSVFKDLKFLQKDVALLCTTGMGCLQFIELGATTVHRYLLNNEQLINKLADSYPIRSAAKFTAYLAQRSKQLAEEGIDKLKDSEPVKKVQETKPTDRLSSFKDTFMKEVKEGIKEIKGKDKER